MIVDAIIVGLAFYFTFPLLNGYCASHYGRSFGVWFGIGCVLPIISFIILVVMISWDEKMTPKHKLSKRERVESEQLVKNLVNKLDRPILSKKPKKNPSKQRS
ncbi:MAG: hypothetical protein AAF600_09300 [Bacteroidota bacterium]